MVRQVTKYPLLSLLGIFLAEHNSDFFLIQIKGLEHLLCSGFYNIQLFRKEFICVFAQVLGISEYCFIKLSNNQFIDDFNVGMNINDLKNFCELCDMENLD